MDLKESVQELHNNETFKHILATLLAVGNFLNGKKVSALAVRIMEVCCHRGLHGPYLQFSIFQFPIMHSVCPPNFA